MNLLNKPWKLWRMGVLTYCLGFRVFNRCFELRMTRTPKSFLGLEFDIVQWKRR